MEQRKIDRHIRLIVTRLKKLQNEDGSWAENNFINALMGYCLSEMETPPGMMRKTADYILLQKSAKWSWNYYPRERYENSGKKYPDDLDDTFCSLIALLKIKPEIIMRDALDNAANVLIRSASKTGGPYFTWVDGVWRDIDPVVNANVSCFYSLFKIEIPQVTRYIDECLESNVLRSNYYHNPLLSYYFIARNYRGLKRNTLIWKIMDCVEKAETEPNGISLTKIALAACALAHLSANFSTVDRLIEKIKNRLDSNYGATTQIEKEPLYIEKITGGKKHYASSAAFTLASCGEAISLHEKEADLLKEMQSTAQKRCEFLPNPLHSEALRMLKKIFANDPFKEILLMPYRITSSSLESSYGLISLYGWLAYTIYDRIIDEKENVDLLPLANMFHRELVVVCGKTAVRKNWRLCQELFDTMDCAEMLEKQTAIPPKKQIVDKSIGLMVPSILALAHSGISPDGSEMKRFVRLFRDYIFVKQMSDDIRDWQDDLKNGIGTRVTGQIKNGLVTPAREIIACYEDAKNIVGKTSSISREIFLLNIIEEYAITAKAFLEKRK